jgi:hypothetical protein
MNLESLKAFLGLTGGAKILKSVFKTSPDQQVCTTRIVREAKGFPWNDQVGVHPLPDGKLEITRIKANDSSKK